jgi:hypothetical protein
MPRARTTTAIEDEGVVKKPRTTRVRAISSSEDSPPKAPRKRAPKRVSEAVVETEPVRKAPTAFREQKRTSSTGTRNFLIIVVICLSIISTGLGIGFSDKGQINVVAIVNERNEKINRGEVRSANGEAITQTIPVQGSDNRPNGGLIPADTPPPVAPPTETAPSESSATTTPELSASSTEEVGGEVATSSTSLE